MVVGARLLMNFLCLPDRLICLSRIDQAERYMVVGARLLMNFLCLPDRLICLSRIDQAEMFGLFRDRSVFFSQISSNRQQ